MRDIDEMVAELIRRRSPWDCSYRFPSVGYWMRTWDQRDRLYAAGWKPCFTVSKEEPCATYADRVEGWTYA